MEYTTNYQLPIWAESDRILMEDFNESYQKLEDALTEHGEALAGKGDCQIYTTSYVGTGYYGYNHSNSLTFPSRPMILFIAGSIGGYLILSDGSNQAAFLAGSFSVRSIEWDGNTLSWDGDDPTAQLNVSNRVYTAVALLAADE